MVWNGSGAIPVLLLLFLTPDVHAQRQLIRRVNCGGMSIKQGSETWESDTAFVTSPGSKVFVASPLSILSSERWIPAPAALTYSVPVPDQGLYEIGLYFAENYVNSAKQRLLSVSIEGVTALSAFDIFASAGSKGKEVLKKFTVAVKDSAVTISISASVQNPKLNAFEVFKVEPPDSPSSEVTAVETVRLIDSLGKTVRSLSEVDSIFPSGNLATFSLVVDVGDSRVQALSVTINNGEPFTDSSEPFQISSSTFLSGYISTCTFFHIKLQPLIHNSAFGKAFELVLFVFSALSTNFALSTNLLSMPVIEPLQDSVSGISFMNNANSPVKLQSIFVTDNSVFTLRVFNTLVVPSLSSKLVQTSIVIPPKSQVRVFIKFSPQSLGIFPACSTLNFDGGVSLPFCIVGLSKSFEEEHTLHPIVRVKGELVDYDGNGYVSAIADGTDSHTHEFGQSLTTYNWKLNFVPLSLHSSSISLDFPIGSNIVELEIVDTKGKKLSVSSHFEVFSSSSVDGCVVRYYAGSLSDLNAISANPRSSLQLALHTVELSNRFELIKDLSSGWGKSNLQANVLILFSAEISCSFTSSHPVSFQVTNGVVCKTFLDGNQQSSSFFLQSGTYSLDFLCFCGSSNSGTSSLRLLIDGSVVAVGDPIFSMYKIKRNHNLLSQSPFISSISPSSGSQSGGYLAYISGIGFKSPFLVVWGIEVLSEKELVMSSFDLITLYVPELGKQSSPVSVTVKSSGVTNSNTKLFSYSSTAVPISFAVKTFSTNIPQGTQICWDYSERLLVASQTGDIHALKFDDAYSSITSQVVISALRTTFPTMPNILGIAMSPFDRHIYVAHSKIYFAGGANPNSQFYPYIGQVSRIRYPGYTVCEAVVTNLPVSNHDHAPNGIQFSDDGTLLLGIGGNTNAGVPHFRLGFLDESPLTAAIVAFRIYAPGFNGKLNYYSSDPTHQLNNDQRFGGSVSLGPMYANYVSVWAAGARNPFDLVYTTTKRIFFTDNGPNQGYGLLSNGPSSTLSDSTETDKLCDATTPNQYFGHPNRNRGRADVRQNYFRGLSSSATDFSRCLSLEFSSAVGITEYRSSAFNGAMRGNLLVCNWRNDVYRIPYSVQSGNSIFSYNSVSSKVPSLGITDPLDIEPAPAGALALVKWFDSGSPTTLYIASPIDSFVSSLQGKPYLYDVSPYRCDPKLQCEVVIGGVNLNGVISVEVAGAVLSVSRKSSSRIVGKLTPPTGKLQPGILQDVVAQFPLGVTASLPASFKWVVLPQSHLAS